MPFESIGEERLEESPSVQSDRLEDILGIPTHMLGSGAAELLEKVDQDYARQMDCVTGATLASLMQR
jgi:hypothetical protein